GAPQGSNTYPEDVRDEECGCDHCEWDESHGRAKTSHAGAHFAISVSAGIPIDATHRSQEPIPSPRQSLDEPRIVRRFAQRFPQLVNGSIQAVVEIDEGFGLPELGAQLFAGDDFAGPLQEQGEDMERLFLELNPHALLAQLPCAQVHLEGSKPQYAGRSRFKGHQHSATALSGV